MRFNYNTAMSSSSIDGQNAADNNMVEIGDVEKYPAPRPPVRFESTNNGDVVVVEPSFDAEDHDGRSPTTDEKLPLEGESRLTTTKNGSSSEGRGHSRNLSDFFQNAASLANDRNDDPSGSAGNYGIRGPPPTESGAVGKKHRRVFSGDVSNPPEAHRRINSIGNSAAIKRRSYGQQRQHQRVDSAGLNILTAAADVSREELAAAAGSRVKGGRNPWDAPPTGSSRRSPVEMVSYDHSQGPPHPPPPPRSHRAYPSGPPPTGYYGPPPPGYPQPPYPPAPYYAYPPPPAGYPVQYARGGPDPYTKHPAPLQHPTDRPRQESSLAATSAVPENKAMTPPPPVPPSHWRGGTTQGVQTYVTSIAVGEGSRNMHPTAAQTSEPPQPVSHHRKTSSLSSWMPTSVFMGPPGESGEHPLKAHHRTTSSTVSFLQGFDVGMDTDTAFLSTLISPAPGVTFSQPASAETKRNKSAHGNVGGGTSKLAEGGTSKRVRRKCTIGGCANRVVQGGLCISHGAKRKQCKHPGCNKNVKKAGLCSTHGPARKRCDEDRCSKVAVQGGKCIAHGAKKKLCAVEACTKQAILSGMCKKHHDQQRGSGGALMSPPPGDSSQYNVIGSGGARSTAKQSKTTHKPTHTRGLSIFQEISADDVGTILSPEAEAAAMSEGRAPRPPGHRHRSTFSREFGSLY